MLNRRVFLQTSTLAALGVLATGSGLAVAAGTNPATASKAAAALQALPTRLIYVALRGGPDGLELTPPIKDKDYTSHRVGGFDRSAVVNGRQLDSLLALSPNLPYLYQLYKGGQLAVIPAVAGCRTRSHFDAMNLIENGNARASDNDSGWINRAIQQVIVRKGIPSAVTNRLTLVPYSSLPLAFEGGFPARTWTDFSANPPSPARQAYRDEVLGQHGLTSRFGSALEKSLESDAEMRAYIAANPNLVGIGSGFPATARRLGRLMAYPNGPRFGFLQLGGFDSHIGQQLNNPYGALLTTLDDGIRELRLNLGAAWENTIVLIGGEFGRTIRPNGTGGTDHGTGGTWFVAGGAVRGGKVYGDWPGLKDKNLYENRDLRPTTELIGVYKGALQAGLGFSKTELDKVFPAFASIAPVTGPFKAVG